MLVTLRVKSANADAPERAVPCALVASARERPDALADKLIDTFHAAAPAHRLDDEDRALMRDRLTSWLVARWGALRVGDAPVFEYVRMNPPRPARPARPRPVPTGAPPAAGPEDDLFQRIEASIDWQGR
jgi:hypothetical protein